MAGYPTVSKAIWDCAVECALYRKKGICYNRFGSNACINCKWYINRYVNADPREVTLFMSQAERKAYEIHYESNRHHFGYALALAIALLLAYFFWSTEKSNEEKQQNRQNSVNTIQPAARTIISSSSVNRNLSEHANIERTLRLVAENWKKIDVNRDGLNNCIDAAVLFYQYYPDKNKVCISVNVNPKTGMNHLFNCVFTDGVWKAIEPQTYAINHSNYLMWAVWGSRYDNSYNRDVTTDYLRYVRK